MLKYFIQGKTGKEEERKKEERESKKKFEGIEPRYFLFWKLVGTFQTTQEGNACSDQKSNYEYPWE